MKKLNILVFAATLAVPLVSFAQSNQAPVTRASVEADLVRLEKAGYDPARSGDDNYPADIQAAEAKIAQQSSPHKVQKPETRAQVESDLSRVEKAGYNPFRNDGDYPEDLQAADAKVEAQTAGKNAPAVKPVTRAQVRADLIKVEKAGFDPFRVSNDYPEDIEAAEAKLSGESTGIAAQAARRPVAKAVKSAVPRIDLPRNPFTDGA